MDENKIDWHAYFKPEDLTDEVRNLLASVPERVAEMHAVLGMPTAPEIRPSGHCFSPFECEFWTRCTASKPSDWIFYLPRLNATTFAELDGNGIEFDARYSVGFFPHSRTAAGCGCRRLWSGVYLGRPRRCTCPFGTASRISGFRNLLASGSAVRRNQSLPAHSIPMVDPLRRRSSDVRHSEFLAEGDSDPRRDFAQKLIVAIGRTSGPIIVYSPFEASVLNDLAAFLPDLSGSLLAVIDRVCDLLPIVRAHVAHPAFLGSYSIKVVAPALVPGFSYDDLDEIAHGDDASAVFYRLASDRSLSNDDRARYRQGLLRYCGRDTLAMLNVHRKLLWCSETNTVLEGEGHGARADRR